MMKGLKRALEDCLKNRYGDSLQCELEALILKRKGARVTVTWWFLFSGSNV